LNALVGGPILALAGFRAARTPLGDGGEKALLALAAAALVANVVVYVTQGVALAGMGNSFGRAIDLAPGFWPALAAFFVLCAAGIVTMIGASRSRSHTVSDSSSHAPPAFWCSPGCSS